MQPQPVFHTSIALGPILLLVCLGITFGVVMAIRHGYGKVVLGIGGVGLVGLLLAGFTFTRVNDQSSPTASGHSNQIATRSDRYSPLETSSSPAPILPPTPTGPAPSLILYTTGNAQPIPIQELPGWRKNPPQEGALGAGRAKYVLTSQQFATVEEAEAELFKSLAVDVQKSFAQYYTPAVGWQPTPEDLRLSGIIAERVVETIPLQVGEFETPVHRVSWLIEFDHDKSTVLLKRWEPIEAQRRAKLILSILAGAAGALGVTAMALRRRRNDTAPSTALHSA